MSGWHGYVHREICGRCGGNGYIEWTGGRLRAKRMLAGLSLREVARRLRLSVAYLSDIELNRRHATERVMRFYRDHCGL